MEIVGALGKDGNFIALIYTFSKISFLISIVTFYKQGH